MKTRNVRRSGEVVTAAEFETAMRRYACAEQRELEINKALEEEVGELLKRYEEELTNMASLKQKAFDKVQAYCVNNKQRLFARTRYIGTAEGKAGFRLGTPRLKPDKGRTWEVVLAGLKMKLPEYIRTVEEPAKDLLLADRNTDHVAKALVELGVQVVQDELFYIVTKKVAA